MRSDPKWRTVLPAVMLLALAACKQKPPDGPSHTPPRTDFAPEEFGVGRMHTRNAACNREIDRLLDEIRICFNTRPAGSCDGLQQANSAKTGRIKNSARCSHR